MNDRDIGKRVVNNGDYGPSQALEHPLRTKYDDRLHGVNPELKKRANPIELASLCCMYPRTLANRANLTSSSMSFAFLTPNPRKITSVVAQALSGLLQTNSTHILPAL